MDPARRQALRATRRLYQRERPQQLLRSRKLHNHAPRQDASTGHATEHAHTHSYAAADEPLGMSVWLAFGSIPAAFLLYFASRSGDANAPPLLTRLIDKYTEAQDSWAAKNALHTRMVEQAGEDRTLFYHSKPSDHVPLKFPEIMNNGSPFNVPAGSQVNLDKVIAKYRQEAYEDNERKLEALRNGTIKSEQPLERGRRWD